MTPNATRAELQRFIYALQEEGLILDSNKVLLLPWSDPNSWVVTWGTDVKLSDKFNANATLDEYLYHLRHRNFSVVLFDGALLQMSYRFIRNEMVYHRLCFYPCPVKFDKSDLAEFSLDDLVELYSSISTLCLESPIRFDYDPQKETYYHPASHLHLSRESCRVPVRAPLSPGHFIKFIFVNFYPEQWQACEFIQSWSCENMDITLRDHQRSMLHIAWY